MSSYLGELKSSGHTLCCPESVSHPDAEDPFPRRMKPTDNINGAGFLAFLNKKKMMSF